MRIVTNEEMLKAQTPAGAWTKATLAGWGVTWPPMAGWKKRLQVGEDPNVNPDPKPISRKQLDDEMLEARKFYQLISTR